MAALLKLGDISGNRSSAYGCTFDAEAVALQASIHRHLQRGAWFSIRGQPWKGNKLPQATGTASWRRGAAALPRI